MNGKVRERWRRDLLDEHADALAALFRRHGVVAAYVFGSLARGRDPARVRDRSDLDLAVLFPEAWGPTQRRHARLALEMDLLDVFDRGDFDLIVANDAHVVLRHHITRERDVVYGRDAPERVSFDWRTWREYMDTEPQRRIRYASVIRRAREGRLGVRPGVGGPAAR